MDGSAQKTQGDARSARGVTHEDYDGKKISIAMGANLETESFKHLPHSEYLSFDGYPGLSFNLGKRCHRVGLRSVNRARIRNY